jgi:hypothetical protein
MINAIILMMNCPRHKLANSSGDVCEIIEQLTPPLYVTEP